MRTETEMGKRAGIIDEVRGIAYILMVLYHIYYDLACVYLIDLPQAVDIVMRFLQPFIAGTFIFVAGISANYSRNNFKRGALYFFIGMMFTFVTSVVMPSETILFGVLHFIGIAAMIYGFIGRFTEKIPAWLGVFLFGLLYFVTISIPRGYIGFDGIFRMNLPEALYSSPNLFPLGFPDNGFSSADYFPIIPNLFLFLAGSSLGTLFKSGRMAKGMYMVRFSGLAFIGRHGIWIYILHQPVILLILELIFKLCGMPTLFL